MYTGPVAMHFVKAFAFFILPTKAHVPDTHTKLNPYFYNAPIQFLFFPLD